MFLAYLVFGFRCPFANVFFYLLLYGQHNGRVMIKFLNKSTRKWKYENFNCFKIRGRKTPTEIELSFY